MSTAAKLAIAKLRYQQKQLKIQTSTSNHSDPIGENGSGNNLKSPGIPRGYDPRQKRPSVGGGEPVDVVGEETNSANGDGHDSQGNSQPTSRPGSAMAHHGRQHSMSFGGDERFDAISPSLVRATSVAVGSSGPGSVRQPSLRHRPSVSGLVTKENGEPPTPGLRRERTPSMIASPSIGGLTPTPKSPGVSGGVAVPAFPSPLRSSISNASVPSPNSSSHHTNGNGNGVSASAPSHGKPFEQEWERQSSMPSNSPLLAHASTTPASQNHLLANASTGSSSPPHSGGARPPLSPKTSLISTTAHLSPHSHSPPLHSTPPPPYSHSPRHIHTGMNGVYQPTGFDSQQPPLSPRSPRSPRSIPHSPMSPKRSITLQPLPETGGSLKLDASVNRPPISPELNGLPQQHMHQSFSKPLEVDGHWEDDPMHQPRHNSFYISHTGEYHDQPGDSDGQDQFSDDEERAEALERARRRRHRNSKCPWFSRNCPDYRSPFWNMQFRFWWDMLLACITLYHFVTIPLRIAKYEHWVDTHLLEYWAIFDYPFDAIYLVDIFFRCFIFIPLDEEFFGDDDGAMEDALNLLDTEEESLLAEAEANAKAKAAAKHAKMNGHDQETSQQSRVSSTGYRRRKKRHQQHAGAHDENGGKATQEQEQEQQPTSDPEEDMSGPESPKSGNGVGKTIHTIEVKQHSPKKQTLSWREDPRYRIFFIYLKGNLVWDVLGSLPLDFIALASGVGVKNIPFLRLNKLIRLRRFSLFFNHFPDTIEEWFHISPSVWRITSIFSVFLLVAHWTACTWCYVGQLSLSCDDSGFCVQGSTESNWLSFDQKNNAPFGTRYVRSLYGMLSTLFTIGLADIRPITTAETIVFMIVAMMGAILCARATATFASIFQKYDAPRVAYETRMANLKAYMSGKFLPQELQERVLYYYEYVWNTSKGMDEKKVLESLPAHLRMEALVFLEGDAIRKVPFFSSASSGLINSIALVLQPSLFSPDTYIQVKGQVGYELYLVHKGECGRIQENDNTPGSSNGATSYRVINVLQSGAYFGELSLFQQHPIEVHKYSIKSFTFLELFKLTRSDFEKVMKLCCNNSETETFTEIDAMYRHQLAHIKSQSKVTKLLGHDFEGSNSMFGGEDEYEQQQKRKFYYRFMLPHSWFRKIWTTISNLIVLYWFVHLPFRITFGYTPYNMILNDQGGTNTEADHTTASRGGTPDDTLRWWLILDVICDVFFLIDILLKTRYFSFYRSFEEELSRQNRSRHADQLHAISEEGDGKEESVSTSESHTDLENDTFSRLNARGRKVNSRPEFIFRRYKRSGGFMYDCLSSIPIDYLIGAVFGWQYYCIPKLIRLFRLHIVRAAHGSFQHWLLNRWKLNPDAYRLLTFFSIYVLLMHWCACCWYGVGLISTSNDGDSWLRHEIDPSTDMVEPPHTDDHLVGRLLIRNYVRAFYFVVVITTTTAGYKDVLAYSVGESIFASFLMITLALLYYASLGVISTMLTQITLSENQFQEKMDTLHTFIKQHLSPTAVAETKAGKVIKNSAVYSDGLSPRLAQTIKNYYTYLWFRQRGVKEEEILAELPTALREEVAVALNYDVISQSMTLFNGCSPALLKSILSKFKYQIYLPNEYLCRANDVANEMFILNRGKAVVVSPNETITYELLNRNTCYGEALFLMQLRRKASVKTIKFCDVSMLTTIDFQNTISAFPLERQKIFENSISVRKRQVKSDHSMALNRKMAKVKQVMAMSFTPTESKFKTWSPNSDFVRNWQTMLLLLSFYHCILIPLRIAFVNVTPVWVFYIEYIADSIFWADIYLNYCRFSFLKHNGHLCKDPQLIAARYKSSGFWIDCAAGFPLDLIALFVSGGRGDWLELMAYLRLPRVLRFLRIPLYFKRMRQFVQDADLGIEVNYVRLMELGIAILLISHWLGCGFFWIARLQGGIEHADSANFTYTWLHAYHIAGSSLTDQYLASLYWALSTVTVVCYGDVIPVTVWEHVYVTAVAVVCFFLVAALIGNIASLITRLDAAAAILTTKLNRFDEYARRHGLPEDLQYRVHQYWIHLHKIQQGVDEEALLNDMPRSLRMAVSTARYLKYIQHQPYFSFCEPNLLHQLTEALKLEVFIPGDMIMCEGDLGRKFYIVKKGQVQIVKGGVGGNNARMIRRSAFGGIVSNKNDRHSPFMTGRRGGGRERRQEPIMGIGQIAAQFHHQSKNSQSSDAASTPDLRGHSIRSRNPISGPTSRINSGLGQHQHGGAAQSGRVTLQPFVGRGGARGGVGASPLHAPVNGRSNLSSRNFPQKSAQHSRQGSNAPSSNGSSHIEMSKFSLNAAPSTNTHNRSRRGSVNPHGASAKAALKASSPHNKRGGSSGNHLVAPGSNGRSLFNTTRANAARAHGHDHTLDLTIPVGQLRPESASPDVINEGKERESISSSQPSYSLREILGTTMLHHASYAQDGIVLPTASGFTVGVNTPRHSPDQPPTASGPTPSPLSQPMPPPHISAEASRTGSSHSSHADSDTAPPTRSVEEPVILQLDEGSMLGELSFFLPLRRTASIYARTFCTFLVLDRKQFNEIMSALPHYVTKMRELARESVESQAMNHANIRRNFSLHTDKLRKLCLLAADPQEKLKWGPEFQQRTATRRAESKHRAWKPVSTFVQSWKLLILCLILYYLYVIPFRICFFEAFPKMDQNWLIFDYLLDGVFACDLYLNLHRFAFIDETLGTVITNAEDISRHYRQTTQFKVDVFTLLPIDIFALAWPEGRQRLFALLMFRLSKILRFGQLFDLVRALAPLENKVLRAFSRVGIGISEGGVRFIKMLQVFILVAHWIGSLWFVVGYQSSLRLAESYAANFKAGADPTHGNAIIGWLQQDGILDATQLEQYGEVTLSSTGTRIYIRSLYFAIKSLCTLGMADITTTGSNSSEMVFAILVIMVSAVVLAAFVATFETTFHNMDEDVAVFHRQMEYNRSYMKTKKLPQGLQDRINLYYSYIWNRSKGLDEDHALSNLSTQLRMDVMMFINQDIIEKVSLFKDCELGFIKSIAVVLQAAVFMPDDIIIRAGTISNQMYFIKDGEILMERHGVLIVELSDGDFFGENHLLNSKPSTANYIAQTFCDLFTLSRHHYEQVIEYYPKYRQLLIWKMNAINAEKRRQVARAAAGLGPEKSPNEEDHFRPHARPTIATITKPVEADPTMVMVHISPDKPTSVTTPPPTLRPHSNSDAGAGTDASGNVRPKRISTTGGKSPFLSPMSHNVDIPSPSDHGFSNRRGSFQDLRLEGERKRQAVLAEYEPTSPGGTRDAAFSNRVVIGNEYMDPVAAAHHAAALYAQAKAEAAAISGGAVNPSTSSPTPSPPPSSTPSPPFPVLGTTSSGANPTVESLTGLTGIAPRQRGSFASTTSGLQAHPKHPHPIEVDVMVPGFRMSVGPGMLPSPGTYATSIVQLDEFQDHEHHHAGLEALKSGAKEKEHQIRISAVTNLPVTSSASSTTTAGSLAPPSTGSVATRNSPRLSPLVGYQTATPSLPSLTLEKQKPLPIIFTPMPHSSPAPYGIQPSPSLSGSPIPVASPPLPSSSGSNRSPESSGASPDNPQHTPPSQNGVLNMLLSNSPPRMQRRHSGEPDTMTYHARHHSRNSPSPSTSPDIIQQQPTSGHKDKRTTWPPRDADIDDGIREELAKMPFAGLTKQQREAGHARSPSGNNLTVPVGVTPLASAASYARWTEVASGKAPLPELPTNRRLEGVDEVAIDMNGMELTEDHKMDDQMTPNPANTDVIIHMDHASMSDPEPVRLMIHASPRSTPFISRTPVSTRTRGNFEFDVGQLSLQRLANLPTFYSRTSSAPVIEAAVDSDPTGILRSALGFHDPPPKSDSISPPIPILTEAHPISSDVDSSDGMSPPRSPLNRTTSLAMGMGGNGGTFRPPQRPRSKSHDFSNMGAENDLQRLLNSTARRVAQHLRKPSRPPKLPERPSQPAAASSSSSSSIGKPLPILKPVKPPPKFDYHYRRHSFNAGIFSPKQEEPAEPTFKSVFDF